MQFWFDLSIFIHIDIIVLKYIKYSLAIELLIGCVMLGAASVTGIDIDEDALAIAQQNVTDFEMEESIELVVGSMAQAGNMFREKFDVVVMNPPFGTKHNKGRHKSS